MKILYTTIAILAAALLSDVSARAAELVMVDSRSCYYCVKFHRSVGDRYNSSAAGRMAPLRRVTRHRWPSDLRAVSRAYATPTFILVEDGREVGRFAGFGTADNFWRRLKPMLARLD